MEYYSAIKSDEVLIHTEVDKFQLHYSERSQTQKVIKL